jgi:rhodanese-related sulfurtransferase
MTARRTAIPCIATSLALISCGVPAKPPPASPPAHAHNPPAQPATPPDSRKPAPRNGRGEISSISLADFFMLQQSGKALIFDARQAFFYNLGHIPGAINLPKNHCDEAIHARESSIKAALAAGKTIVVYCSSITCPDAGTVATHFSGFGYPVSTYSGGWDGWREADMPRE